MFRCDCSQRWTTRSRSVSAAATYQSRLVASLTSLPEASTIFDRIAPRISAVLASAKPASWGQPAASGREASSLIFLNIVERRDISPAWRVPVDAPRTRRLLATLRRLQEV